METGINLRKAVLVLLTAVVMIFVTAGAFAEANNSDLFYEYMLKAAGVRPPALRTRGIQARETLSENAKKVYDYLKKVIIKIASGEESSTEISFTLGDVSIAGATLSEEEIDIYFGYPDVINALLADCPYELYWYDKTEGVSYGLNYFSKSGDGTAFVFDEETEITFIFSVAAEYAENESSVSRTKIAEMRVAEAVAEAKAIVNTYIGKSDYSKLAAYKKAICDRVSYDEDAAGDVSTPYGNPWQLVWVFDGISTTNVVCEGYAKAFQYLCDLSTFIGDVRSYLVSGSMVGGTGAGDHMWNMVRLEDANYLVDVTNCDGDFGNRSIGYPDFLFLKGAAYNDGQGYDYTCVVPRHDNPDEEPGTYFNPAEIRYVYDSETLSLWQNTGILPPSTADYTVHAETQDPWLDEWQYEITNDECVLKKQTGSANVLVIPGTATVNGEDYPVVLKGTGNQEESPFIADVTSITVNGAKFAGDCGYLFYNLSNCDTLSLDVDTSRMTSMDYMFYNCSGLQSLDLQAFNTSSVISMVGAFNDCSNLKTLDLSGFNTSNVIQMESMFAGCRSLEEIIVDSFDTEKVMSMANMFQGCSALTTLDLSSFTNSALQTTFCMFDGCTNLKTIEMNDGFIGPSAVQLYGMFKDCESLKSVNTKGWNTCNVSDMYSLFDGCKSLESADVSGFDTSKVTSMGYMFFGCEKLKEIDVSSFDTKNVTNMWGMFSGCSSITDLNVSNFKTSNVTNMDYMFGACTGLAELNLSSFDTSNVTSMKGMFQSCSGLRELDLSAFDTSNVTDMEGMFYSCYGLKTIDVSSFQTENVTAMNYMFAYCTGLEKLDLSSFNTGSVTAMDRIFTGFMSPIKIGESFFFVNTYLDNSIGSHSPKWYSYKDKTWYSPEEIADRAGIQDTYSPTGSVFSPDMLSIEFTEAEYTGDEIKPAVVIANDSGELVQGADYELQYANNTNAGTATVKATGMGEYSGTIEVTFTIHPKPIADEMIIIENAEGIIYSGEAVEPIVIRNGETVLEKDTDYSILYTDNVNAGNATAAITGIGNYCSTVSKMFTIKKASLTIAITGDRKEYFYDGTEKAASGYTAQCESTLFEAEKLAFTGTSEVRRTEAGMYNMGLTADQFSYNDPNFENNAFSITDGILIIHTFEKTEAKAPTCTEPGNSEYYTCSELGKYYDAERNEIEIDSWIIPALGHRYGEATYTWAADNSTVTATRICANNEEHIETETVAVSSEITTPAGCETKGKTTYTSAAFQNAAFTVQTKTEEDVPAKGHVWGEATYTWAADNSTVTAERICANNEEHKETETVTVSSEITTPAGCETKGKTTYTSAAFENAAFTVQTKTEEDVPAKGHVWGAVTYTWAADNSSVTATGICAVNEEHRETETVAVSSEITTSAGCETKGKTTYTSAAFQNAAFTVQTKTEEDVPATGHAWGKATYTWAADNSSVTAERICAHNEEHKEAETAAAANTVTKEAMCETAGEMICTAAFTNPAFEDQRKTEVIRPLGHELENHEGKKPTCTESGWESYVTCSRCDYTTYAEIAALGHKWISVKYNWADDYSAVTAIRVCVNDETHVETETVETKIVEDSSGEGNTAYMAVFSNPAFEAKMRTIDFEYSLNNDGSATVTIASPDENNVIAIPGEINGMPISTVSKTAFENVDTENVLIKIPKTVHKVEEDALPAGAAVTTPENSCTWFYGMAYHWELTDDKEVKVATFEVPSALSTLSANAFENTDAECVILPAGCSVEKSAFANCPKLTTVVFHEEAGKLTEIFGEDEEGSDILMVNAEFGSAQSLMDVNF